MKIQNVSLTECLYIIGKNRNKLENTQGHVKSLVKKKFTYVSGKNQWLK